MECHLIMSKFHIDIFFATKVQFNCTIINRKEDAMKPKGSDILATLIKLLADQYQVSITYEIEQEG